MLQNGYPAGIVNYNINDVLNRQQNKLQFVCCFLLSYVGQRKRTFYDTRHFLNKLEQLGLLPQTLFLLLYTFLLSTPTFPITKASPSLNISLSCSRAGLRTVLRGVYPILQLCSAWLPSFYEYFWC